MDAAAIIKRFARCADPRWWTQTIAFTAARAPGGERRGALGS